MNLGELIIKARNIGDMFTSWLMIDTNVESIELLGNSEEGYRVKVKLKQEPIDEEELGRLAEEENPNVPDGDSYEVGQYFGFNDGFKAGYYKALEDK